MGLLDKLKGLFSKSNDTESVEEQNNPKAEATAQSAESKDSNAAREAASTPKSRMRERIAQHQANAKKTAEMREAHAATLAAAREKLAALEAKKANASGTISGTSNSNAEDGAHTSSSEAQQVADSGKSILDERLQMERLFCSQPKEHRIRITKDTPVTLGEFIAKVYEIPAENIQEMYVVTDDDKGKEVRGVESAADYDMLSDFITLSEDDCQPKGKDRNVILNITFNDGPFQRMTVHMNCDGTYGANAQLLVKLSFMNVKVNGDVEWDFAYLTFDMTLPEELLKEVDEIKRTAAEKYRRGQRLDDREKQMLQIPDVSSERAKAEKYIKEGRFGDAISILTRVYKFIKPLLSQNEVNENVQKYAMAICMQLAICYTQLGLFDQALYWAELAYSFDKSDFKLLATASLNAKDIRVLELFKIKDPKLFGFYPGSPYIEPYKMGVVLNKCFSVLPSELSRMVLVKDDDPSQTEVIEGIENIWTFDFIDKMKKLESMTAFISYRSDRDLLERLKAVRNANEEAKAEAEAKAAAEEEKAKAEVEAEKEAKQVEVKEGVEAKSEADSESSSNDNAEVAQAKKKKVSPASKKTSIYQFVDLSKDRTDNEIIINFSKRYRSREEFINMEVMVPEFRHSENNNNGNPMVKDYLFYTGSYFTMDEFEETRQEAKEKDENGEDLTADEQYANGELIDARFNMIMGRASGDNKAWGDALYYLYKAQQLFAYEYLSGNEDGNAVELIQELCYRLGYIFSQSKLYEQALGFLMRNRGEMVSKYQFELVNAMCNGQDYRAYNYIKTMLDDIESEMEPDEYPDKTTQAFLSFLKRRFAYILIERGQLKKAESFLETMLNDDKRTRDFAEFELQYIQDKAVFEQNLQETQKAKEEEKKEEAAEGEKEVKEKSAEAEKQNSESEDKEE